VEIGISSKVPAMPFVVQVIAITKNGTNWKTIPLFVKTFTLHLPITIVVSKPMEDNEKSNKEYVELVNTSFTILDNGLESLEFLFVSLLLTPHQIGIGQEVTLISSTLHALNVFTTPITTFENTPDQYKTSALIGLKILSQNKPVEEASAKPIKETINKLITTGQSNIEL
jgi:hypothetical protein